MVDGKLVGVRDMVFILTVHKIQINLVAEKKIQTISSYPRTKIQLLGCAHFFEASKNSVRVFVFTVTKSQILQTFIQSCFHIFRPMPRLSSADDVSFLFQSHSLYVVQNRFPHPRSLSLSHSLSLPFKRKRYNNLGLMQLPKSRQTHTNIKI